MLSIKLTTKPLFIFVPPTQQIDNMECSICCDEIVAATGQVTLGCSHQFHLGCVGRWLLKSSTCPMCRGETCAKEKILADDEMIEFEEDEEEGDNDEEEVDDEQIPEFDDAAHALWVMRKTFEMLDDGLSIASDPLPLPVHAVLPVPAEFPHYRSPDSIDYVRSQRSTRASGLIWRMAIERGYESS